MFDYLLLCLTRFGHQIAKHSAHFIWGIYSIYILKTNERIFRFVYSLEAESTLLCITVYDYVLNSSKTLFLKTMQECVIKQHGVQTTFNDTFNSLKWYLQYMTVLLSCAIICVVFVCIIIVRMLNCVCYSWELF